MDLDYEYYSDTDELNTLPSDVLYGVQKAFQCLAVTSVFTCIALSFTVILMLGVGLGYNHCFVELKGKKKNKTDDNTLRTEEADSEIIYEKEQDRGTDRDGRAILLPADTTEDPLSPTMIITLQSKKNILRLADILNNIRRQRLNVTLEIIGN